MRSWLHTFDRNVTTTIQHWPHFARPVMLFATFVGQPVLTVSIGVIIMAVAWDQSDASLLLAGATVLVAIGVGIILKLLFQRTRPITDYVLAMRFDTFSLPSGHALGATAAYGLLAYLAWRLLPALWNGASAIVLVLLIIMVGLSRIYLGAHYPSDVIVGWLLGAAAMAVIVCVIWPQA